MNFRIRISLSVLAAAVLLLAGCAGAPEEQTSEEQPVSAAPKVDEEARAEALAAIDKAQEAIDEAKLLGADWRDAQDVLDQAQGAFDDGDFDKAKILADEARNQAELAINQFYLDKAKPLIDEAREYQDVMNDDQKRRLQEAQRYYDQREGKKAYDTAKRLVEEVRAVPVPMGKQTQSYTVKPGDNLWDIAAKFDIYGNPLEWPLIFKENQEAIRDADLIRPGQELTVDMSPSEDEVQRAIEHARTRGPWRLGEVEESDRRYLGRGRLRIE